MGTVRLAELCGATSLFTDVGTGQPTEHALRTTSIAVCLAEALGADDALVRETFYVSLLRFLGCTVDAHVVAGMAGGDDLAFLGGMAPVTMGSPREEVARLLGLVGRGERLPRRLRRLARALTDPSSKVRLLSAHCEVAVALARRMSLPAEVCQSLAMGYARWDGRGVPDGIEGEAIPVSMRLAIVARDVELWARETDPLVTEDVLRSRRGKAYAPAVVDAALGIGIDELRRNGGDVWDDVMTAEPSPWLSVSGVELDEALGALGDFADLKSPDFAGHSRRAAQLAAAMAEHRGIGADDAEILTRAAAVHDLGVVAVPTGVWRSPRRWSLAELEQVRLHPMWTQRMLTRCRPLTTVARVAGRHHERLDGSGYPAGVWLDEHGETAGVADLLACVDLFDERTSPRPHRPLTDAATDASTALAEMRALAGVGALARVDVEALGAVVGDERSAVVVERPAGLTERELDVLRLLARGCTNREIAAALGISGRTVGAHVEHIYAKAGVHSRAAATLFAVQHDLLG